MKLAVAFIERILSQSAEERRGIQSSSTMENEQTDDLEKKVIFIHCKGGRGRAVITCLCYLISKGSTLQESFQQIKSCRSVASEGVLYSSIVKEFEKWIQLEQRDVRSSIS